MIYRSGDMVLCSVRDMFKNEINDVVICQDQASAARPYYTLVAVKDRKTAKALISVFERQSRDMDEPAYIKCFSHNEQLCYLFPYHVERNLESFAEGQGTNRFVRESICINLVLACLSSPLPFPLLYLILNQKQVHIEKDNSIFFTYSFDLRELNANIDEAGCTVRCVKILLDILQEPGRRSLKSFELLRKKTDSRSYRQFTELYRDIRISALPERKSKFFSRLRSFWEERKDVLFRILLVVSIVSAVIALLMLLSYLIFGDFMLLRLFGGSIDKIGTEEINLK